MRQSLIILAFCLTWGFSFAQGSLFLEIVEEHSGVVGTTNLEGLTTYRLYYTPDEQGDIPILVFGHEQFPLEIRTSTSFYQSPAGLPMGGEYFETIFDFLPELEYDSWVTIAIGHYYSPDWYTGLFQSDSSWVAEFDEEGNSLIINDPVGAGWFGLFQTSPTIMPTVDGNILMGQFTTSGNLWGTLNIDYVKMEDLNFSYGDLGLTFGSSDEMVQGCMDENALNYDPLAVVNDGCAYLQGDLNGDGMVNVIDVLELLNDLGCLEDCGLSDVNGDGVVNIWDLLEILGLLD